MWNEAAFKERYQRDPVAVRLGNLSSDLARIANLLGIPFCKPVPAVIREAEFFIEWCVGDVEAELQPALVAMQVQLARWWLRWPQHEPDLVTREQIGGQCREWADWVLAKSGLLGSTVQ